MQASYIITDNVTGIRNDINRFTDARRTAMDSHTDDVINKARRYRNKHANI